MSEVLDRIRARHAKKPDIAISIPEWDLQAFIRPLSAGKMAALRASGNTAHIAAQTIIHGLVDAEGKQIFKDDAETAAEILKERHKLIDRIAAEIVMEGDLQSRAKNY